MKMLDTNIRMLDTMADTNMKMVDTNIKLVDTDKEMKLCQIWNNYLVQATDLSEASEGEVSLFFFLKDKKGFCIKIGYISIVNHSNQVEKQLRSTDRV